MAVHIALHEIGARFQPHPMSFKRGDMQRAAFLALNPEGKVPLLLIDGQPLAEVAAILFYLARRFPAARLWPPGIAAQARAVAWMGLLAGTVHPARRAGPATAQAVWTRIEARLAAPHGRGGWVLGGYSVVDIHLFRLFWRHCAGLPDAAAWPVLAAHHGRMMAREAVARTIAIEAAIGYELPA